MALILAMFLDAIFGEPKWLWDRAPHPAVLMGHLVGWLDTKLNNRTRKAGILAVMVMVGAAALVGQIMAELPGIWAEVIFGAILFAQRSLVQHVQNVADALRLSVSDGRGAVAMIVGRDVREMDGPAVARGAIESAAENLSDGVIAPVFWFAIAGLPGLFVYKIVNTADSMIGYRTDKYEAFGWAAAKFDDLINWLPARFTAFLIWFVAENKAPWREIVQDAALHRSPNAGWPEAAMAPALDVSLSGPRSYGGALEEFPWVNPEGRKDVGPDDVDGAIGLLWKAWALAAGTAIVSRVMIVLL